MIHLFSEDIIFEGPGKFTDPFRYSPHPLVRKAASEVIGRIESDSNLAGMFEEGKMLGVLICSCPDGSTGYITGFSGNAGGYSTIEGFVPPIYDLTGPEGYFKREEARISELNRKISALAGSERLTDMKKRLDDCRKQADMELEAMRLRMQKSRKERDAIRTKTSDPDILSGLAGRSQFEKAGYRRLKTLWAERISGLQAEYDIISSELDGLKKLRARMSDELQNWIFRQYIVHNRLGEEACIADIFAGQRMVPPGGTGECAAPKMLEYAFRNGLKPLAMGEFWYGRSPDTAVRTQGHFYPSCTSKCGPLLKFMLKGMDISEIPLRADEPAVIFEDEAVIVVEKPGGMPSVPGLDGRTSLQEWLSRRISGQIHAVHRLDMDTSGVMVYAKTEEAAVKLRRQFEEHSVRKIYTARLSPGPEKLEEGSAGTMEIPLSPDYDERPRQKADRMQGKPAVTAYEVVSVNEDGSADVIFRPVTGRTHQLRVHSAHILGLAHPIAGDLLYGGYEADRLCLHALSIAFRHPVSGEEVCFTGRSLTY